MKSVINTIEAKINGLECELNTFGSHANFSERIVKECTQELKEHKRALMVLTNYNKMKPI